MKRHQTLTVQQQYAGQYADGKDRFQPCLRLRGMWLGDVFAPGAKVRVTREERAGKLVLVIEAADERDNGEHAICQSSD